MSLFNPGPRAIGISSFGSATDIFFLVNVNMLYAKKGTNGLTNPEFIFGTRDHLLVKGHSKSYEGLNRGHTLVKLSLEIPPRSKPRCAGEDTIEPVAIVHDEHEPCSMRSHLSGKSLQILQSLLEVRPLFPP